MWKKELVDILEDADGVKELVEHDTHLILDKTETSGLYVTELADIPEDVDWVKELAVQCTWHPFDMLDKTETSGLYVKELTYFL
jgi:hypothetical protein